MSFIHPFLRYKSYYKMGEKIMQSGIITFCSAFSGGKMYPNNVAITMKASANEKHVHCLSFALRFLFSVPQFLWSERLISPSCQQVEFRVLKGKRCIFLFVFFFDVFNWNSGKTYASCSASSIYFLSSSLSNTWKRLDFNPETFNIVLMCKYKH